MALPRPLKHVLPATLLLLTMTGCGSDSSLGGTLHLKGSSASSATDDGQTGEHSTQSLAGEDSAQPKEQAKDQTPTMVTETVTKRVPAPYAGASENVTGGVSTSGLGNEDAASTLAVVGVNQPISMPACNGQWIRITYSAIYPPTYAQEINYNLGLDSRSEYTTAPCSSIRSHVDGNRVYAVYVPYGHDVAGACADAAQLGGNVRSLNTSGDFSSPC